MPGEEVVPAAAAEAPRTSNWEIAKTLLTRCLFMYFISSMFRRGTTPPADSTGVGQPAGPIGPVGNIVPANVELDMFVYLCEHSKLRGPDSALHFWKQRIEYPGWFSGKEYDGLLEHDATFDIGPSIQNNGSIWIHVYFVPAGTQPEMKGKPDRLQWSKSQMISKFARRRFHQTTNLLTGATDAPKELIRSADDERKFEILSHWHPNITINLLDDNTTWIRGQTPPPMDDLVEFLPNSNRYYPVAIINDYWNMHSDYQPINDTITNLTLHISYYPISLWKLQMYASQGMRKKWYGWMGDDVFQEDPEEQDAVKRAMLETNPYLLGMTIAVSLLHTVFEFLAFKNDIQFWRTRESLEGLSIRSVFFNLIQSGIVFLYICDHDTNFMVKVSVFVGMLIESWKIFKVVDVSINHEILWFGVIPSISVKNKSTYNESPTKEYDRQAFRYLGVALFPLLVGYAVYSLIYNEHKGWYSFVLSMLYGFLLTFGFIMMTPQLFINYKMKSVAHLPWRMLTYKALNTFIDDIFAFVIRMPTLYRLGCLRDDLIFFIYLYQKWIYPVDKSRVNEYGVSGDQLEGAGLTEVEGSNETTQAIEEDGSGDAPVEPKKTK